MKRIFLVQHLHTLPGGGEDLKLIGVYSSSASAQAAIDRLKQQPGSARGLLPALGVQVKLHTLTNAFAFLIGACVALLGVVWVFMTASGAVKTDPVAGYVYGAGFMLAAAPLLAFPISTRVVKSLLVLAMFALAFGALWLAFQPNSPACHPALVQVAAIAFVVMLLARVVLVLHRKRSALGN